MSLLRGLADAETIYAASENRWAIFVESDDFTVQNGRAGSRWLARS